MSETMNAGGAQTLESRLRLNDQTTPTENPAGTYDKIYRSPEAPDVAAMTVTRVDVNDPLPNYYFTLTPGNSAGEWKTVQFDASVISDIPITALQFAIAEVPGSQVYVSLCTLVGPPQTCLLVYYPSDNESLPEPLPTGVWLGTSSGGGSHPCHHHLVKA